MSCVLFHTVELAAMFVFYRSDLDGGCDWKAVLQSGLTCPLFTCCVQQNPQSHLLMFLLIYTTVGWFAVLFYGLVGLVRRRIATEESVACLAFITPSAQ